MKIYGILMMMLLMSTALAADTAITIGDPTSPMYGLGLMFEGFHEEIVGVAFGAEAKLELQATHMNMRMAEVEKMVQEGEGQGLQKALQAMERTVTRMRTLTQTKTINQGALNEAAQVMEQVQTRIGNIDAGENKSIIQNIRDESGGWMKDKAESGDISGGLKPGRVK